MSLLSSAGFMQRVRDVVGTDDGIKDFCITNYGRAPVVYLGIDDENPPSQGEMPVIVIYEAPRSMKGEDSRVMIYECEIGVVIYQDAITVNGNIKTYDGLVEVEELRELVESATLKDRLGKVSVHGDTSTEYWFPIFRSNTTISLERVRSSREPLE